MLLWNYAHFSNNYIGENRLLFSMESILVRFSGDLSKLRLALQQYHILF